MRQKNLIPKIVPADVQNIMRNVNAGPMVFNGSNDPLKVPNTQSLLLGIDSKKRYRDEMIEPGSTNNSSSSDQRTMQSFFSSKIARTETENAFSLTSSTTRNSFQSKDKDNKYFIQESCSIKKNGEAESKNIYQDAMKQKDPAAASTSATSDGKNQLPLQWVCEHCERAVFDTYKEACDHEAICPEGLKKAEKNNAILSKDNTSAATAVCKETPASSALNNTSSSSSAPPHGEKIQWVCEFCETAVFDTYQEACDHEAKCASNPSNKALKPDDAAVGRKKENSSSTASASSSHVLDKSSSNNCKNEVLQWVCVYCEKAVFPTYQEACDHEEVCPEAPTNKKA